jgi:hypothetical protein
MSADFHPDFLSGMVDLRQFFAGRPSLLSRIMLVMATTPIPQAAAGATRPAAPAMPREHGAWGILLIPFFTAIGVARVVDAKVLLLLGSILAFYLARTSWLKNDHRWTMLLLAGSALLAAPLLAVWQLWWLPVFGLAAMPLAARKTQHGLAMQLTSIAGLTLTAPAAWYVATGRLDATAAILWLLNALYFVGGVFQVKMHIAAAINRAPLQTFSDRIRRGALNLAYHLAALMLVSALVVAGQVPAATLAAFVLALGRALAATLTLTPQLRIKRLGWSEVVYSLLFMLILIFTMQPGHFSP